MIGWVPRLLAGATSQTRLIFEFGDPKLVKEKLGKIYITRFYLTLLRQVQRNSVWTRLKNCDILAPWQLHFRFRQGTDFK